MRRVTSRIGEGRGRLWLAQRSRWGQRRAKKYGRGRKSRKISSSGNVVKTTSFPSPLDLLWSSVSLRRLLLRQLFIETMPAPPPPHGCPIFLLHCFVLAVVARGRRHSILNHRLHRSPIHPSSWLLCSAALALHRIAPGRRPFTWVDFQDAEIQDVKLSNPRPA